LVPYSAALDLPQPWSGGSPCSSSLARVTDGASSRRTGVPWSVWCTCAGTTPSPSSRPASASPSAPPTPTGKPSHLLADRAPGLLRALCEADPDYVLLESTLAECDRADFSHKHRRHGVNVQVLTDPVGQMLSISPTLPGRAHDLTAARAHQIIRICERQGVPLLADRAYMGAGPWLTTPLRRPPGRELTLTQHTANHALSAARAPVERGVARLKSCRIFHRTRTSPNRMPSITAAIPTLKRQR